MHCPVHTGFELDGDVASDAPVTARAKESLSCEFLVLRGGARGRRTLGSVAQIRYREALPH